MTNYEDLVSGIGRAFSPAEVRLLVDGPHNRVQAALARLVQKNSVIRVSEGVYMTAERFDWLTARLSIAQLRDGGAEFLARFEMLMGAPILLQAHVDQILDIRSDCLG